jgi:hypothetical protein
MITGLIGRLTITILVCIHSAIVEVPRVVRSQVPLMDAAILGR